MPFTPFHFGPGAAIKAAIPRHFSFTVFCFAQVAIDCETAYYMIQGVYPWHRFFHTYVGATLLGVFSVLVGRPVCQFALRLVSPVVISWRSAVVGAFVGVYSHIILDSIMHEDITPLMPFSSSNALYQAVSFSALHLSCVLLGIFGLVYVAYTHKRSE